MAGGWRNLLCDQPDVLYSVGALNVQRGHVYELQIPASAAVYTIVTVSNLGGQAFWDIEHADRPEAFNIAIADGAKTGVDTTSHQGLCMLLVRQYFRAPSRRHPAFAIADDDREGGPPATVHRSSPARCRHRVRNASTPVAPSGSHPRASPGNRSIRRCSAPPQQERIHRRGAVFVSRFALRPGDVLQVDYDARGALWFAFSVSNFHLENIAHINSYQLERNTDGTYTDLRGLGRRARAQRVEHSRASLRDSDHA